MNNEKKYRLLDANEYTMDGDEYITSHGDWIKMRSSVLTGTLVIRREDDGRGKYVLSSSDQGATEFYNFLIGGGWRLKGSGFDGTLNPTYVIWRKEREVMEKIVENDKKYRLLKVGELILKTDEFWSYLDNNWVGGDLLDPNRPLYPQDMPHRRLDDGEGTYIVRNSDELIQDDDTIFINNGWHVCLSHDNVKVGKKLVAYKRRLKQEAPEGWATYCNGRFHMHDTEDKAREIAAAESLRAYGEAVFVVKVKIVAEYKAAPVVKNF